MFVNQQIFEYKQTRVQQKKYTVESAQSTEIEKIMGHMIVVQYEDEDGYPTETSQREEEEAENRMYQESNDHELSLHNNPNNNTFFIIKAKVIGNRLVKKKFMVKNFFILYCSRMVTGFVRTVQKRYT